MTRFCCCLAGLALVLACAGEPDVAEAPESSSQCLSHIDLHSAARLAEELGQPEEWVLANHRIQLWEQPSDRARGASTGSLRPGSHALILEERAPFFFVESPEDGSRGWISRARVAGVALRDTASGQLCSVE